MAYGFKSIAANGSSLQIDSSDTGIDFFIPLQSGSVVGTNTTAAIVTLPYNAGDEIDIFVNRSDITNNQWATVYHENFVPGFTFGTHQTNSIPTDRMNPTNDRLAYSNVPPNDRYVIQGGLYTYQQTLNGGTDIGGLVSGNKYYIKTNYQGNAGTDLANYAIDFSTEANGPTGARVNLYRRTISSTTYDIPPGSHVFTNTQRYIKFIGSKGTSSNPLYHIASGPGTFNYLISKRVDQQGTPTGSYGLQVLNANGDLAFDSRFFTQYGTVNPHLLVSAYTRYGKFQDQSGSYPTSLSNALSTDRTLYARITDFAGYEDTGLFTTFKHKHGYLFANNVSHINARSNSATGCWFISQTEQYNGFTGFLTQTNHSYNYGGTFLIDISNLT